LKGKKKIEYNLLLKGFDLVEIGYFLGISKQRVWYIREEFKTTLILGE